ncbi:MAG: glycosyltransferase, partial [Microthrixaceae bacterium]
RHLTSDRRLLVITDSYPFGGSAPFIAAELQQLSERFASVEVAPTHPRGARADLPDGAGLDLGLSARIASRTRCLANSILRSGRGLLRADLAELARSNVDRSPRALYESALWAGQAAGAVDWFTNRGGAQPDLVYSYWFSAPISGLSMAVPTIPMATRAHRGDLYEEASSSSRLPLRAGAMEEVDLVAAVSQHGVEYLANRYPSAGADIALERLGVSEASGLNQPPSSLVVVSCSMVKPVKRLDRLVSALACLPPSVASNARWVHFGDGPSMDQLQAGATGLRKLGLKVELRGFVDNTTVRDAFASDPFSVFVNTSDSEGVPVSIMEALSAGIPVVATDVGGTSEIVDDSVGRVLGEPDDAAELARAIEQVAKKFDHTEARQVVVDRWAERCSAERNYTSFADMLHRMAEGDPPGQVRA